ncbi:hypothetical protein MNB_SUP05-5-361 [hydrothermal vent metagenome]|uniref:DUF2141 domain-containing protein n=1 Tax=hydrothermal vent metagenome TaxID=652676 RepID=A0A1W1BPJ5_9ZZZZ
MKITTKIILLILSILSTLTYSADIEIIIENIQPISGNLSVAIDTSNTFSKDNKSDSIFSVRQKVSKSNHKIVINNVKAGTYAISILHDENNNHKLDTNFFGIPYEGYGFSNNIIGYFGKPNFKEVSFNINKDTIKKTFNIKLVR